MATLTATFASPDPAGKRAVRILWLGDSTAAGVGASSPEAALSSQVGRRLVGPGSPDSFHVEVIAKSGARISDVVRTQLPRVAKLRPDVVAISVGANDTIHLTRARTFRARYDSLLEGLQRSGVDAERVVIVGVPDMGAPPRLRQPLRALVGWRGRRLDRESHDAARRHGTAYVDLFNATSKPFPRAPVGVLRR